MKKYKHKHKHKPFKKKRMARKDIIRIERRIEQEIQRIGIKEVPLEWHIEKLKHKDHFVFVRYGDAEWRTLLRGCGIGGSHLQPIDKKIQAEMIRDLVANSRAPQTIFSMQYYARKAFRISIPKFLHEYKLEHISWINADIFHHASKDGLLYPLIEQLRKMKVVVIGPNFLRKIKDNVFDYSAFIEVPQKNCYSEKDNIKSRILSIRQITEENVVYSFCCGLLAETLIFKLRKQIPKNFLIDFGAVWDVFCGQVSRGYTKRKCYTDQILKKNLGLE